MNGGRHHPAASSRACRRRSSLRRWHPHRRAAEGPGGVGRRQRHRRRARRHRDHPTADTARPRVIWSPVRVQVRNDLPRPVTCARRRHRRGSQRWRSARHSPRADRRRGAPRLVLRGRRDGLHSRRRATGSTAGKPVAPRPVQGRYRSAPGRAARATRPTTASRSGSLRPPTAATRSRSTVGSSAASSTCSSTRRTRPLAAPGSTESSSASTVGHCITDELRTVRPRGATGGASPVGSTRHCSSTAATP